MDRRNKRAVTAQEQAHIVDGLSAAWDLVHTLPYGRARMLAVTALEDVENRCYQAYRQDCKQPDADATSAYESSNA